MTITADAVMSAVQVGILTGIFYRMGGMSAGMASLKERLEKLEGGNA